MTKELLYNFFCLENVSTDTIMHRLVGFNEMSQIDADLLLKFCRETDVVSDETFDSFFLLFSDLSNIYYDSNKSEFTTMLIEFFNMDYISNYDDLIEIIPVFSQILDFQYSNLSEDESDDFILDNFREFFIMFDNINKFSINQKYNNSLIHLANYYINVMSDLYNSSSNTNDEDKLYLFYKRLHIFAEIATDVDNYNLEEIKYLSLLNAASSVSNVDELNKLKKSVKRINEKSSVLEFQEALEKSVNEFNLNTIDVLRQELGYSTDVDENGSLTFKKILEKNEDKSLKKVLLNSNRHEKFKIC